MRNLIVIAALSLLLAGCATGRDVAVGTGIVAGAIAGGAVSGFVAANSPPSYYYPRYRRSGYYYRGRHRDWR